VQTRIAPSAQVEAQIESLLLDGLSGEGDGDELERLSKLGRLGASSSSSERSKRGERFLRRARFERTPDARGSRNGHRVRQIATAEGPLTIAVPQVRDSLTRFVSSVIPTAARRSGPDRSKRSSSGPTCVACPRATSSPSRPRPVYPRSARPPCRTSAASSATAIGPFGPRVSPMSAC